MGDLGNMVMDITVVHVSLPGRPSLLIALRLPLLFSLSLEEYGFQPEPHLRGSETHLSYLSLQSPFLSVCEAEVMRLALLTAPEYLYRAMNSLFQIPEIQR